MNTQIAAAVERLKAHDEWNISNSDVSPYEDNGTFHLDDLLVLCDAVLPEFDATLVDEAWLKSTCGRTGDCKDSPSEFYDDYLLPNQDRNQIYIRVCYASQQVPQSILIFAGHVRLAKNPTRGQVRTLCRALSIPLKEPQ